MFRKTLMASATGVLLTGSIATWAAPQVQDPWYIGLGVSHSHLGLHGSDFDNGFGAQGLTTTTSMDDSHTGWNLALGYRFSPYLSVEGGYTDLGRFGYSSSVSQPATDSLAGTFKAHAWSLSPVGFIPMSDRFALFGKLGITRVTSDQSVASSTGATSPVGGSHSNTGWLLGVGASYDITRNVYARLEWDRYDRVGVPNAAGRSDVDQLGASIGLRF